MLFCHTVSFRYHFQAAKGQVLPAAQGRQVHSYLQIQDIVGPGTPERDGANEQRYSHSRRPLPEISARTASTSQGCAGVWFKTGRVVVNISTRFRFWLTEGTEFLQLNVLSSVWLYELSSLIA